VREWGRLTGRIMDTCNLVSRSERGKVASISHYQGGLEGGENAKNHLKILCGTILGKSNTKWGKDIFLKKTRSCPFRRED